MGASLARDFRFAERSTDLATEARAGVSITNGIGTGFVTYTAIKVLGGKGRSVHWMLYPAAAAFVVYCAVPAIEARLR